MKQIVKSEFIEAVGAGKTRKELMEQFELPLNIVKSFAKELNLTIKRDFKPKFVLVDAIDTQPTNQLSLEKELAEAN